MGSPVADGYVVVLSGRSAILQKMVGGKPTINVERDTQEEAEALMALIERDIARTNKEERNNEVQL